MSDFSGRVRLVSAGRRGFLVFLAALLTTLASLGIAVTASAVNPTGPENRVRASAQDFTELVGLTESVSAGQQLGNNPVQVELVVATGVAANTASRFGNLTHASSGIAPYSTQRLITAGQGGATQAHHLVEKRFAAVMGQNTADMSAIVVTRAEHQVFTNAWRQAIPYGSRNVTPGMVNNAARNIYRDYPEILQALGLG